MEDNNLDFLESWLLWKRLDKTKNWVSRNKYRFPQPYQQYVLHEKYSLSHARVNIFPTFTKLKFGVT